MLRSQQCQSHGQCQAGVRGLRTRHVAAVVILGLIHGAVGANPGQDTRSFWRAAIQAESGVRTVKARMITKRQASKRDDGRNTLLTIDNVHNVIKCQITDQHGGNADSLQSAQVQKVIIHSPRQTGQISGHDEVLVNPPRWPPVWPYNFIRSRPWAGFLSSIQKGQLVPKSLYSNAITGEAVLELSGTKPDSYDSILTVDTRHSYIITHITRRYHGSGRLQSDWTLTYGGLGAAGTVPTAIDEGEGDSAGVRVVSHTIYSVDNILVNAPVSQQSLALRNYPLYADVHDYRFTPPLDYYQGKEQYSDRELFSLSKNRTLLSGNTAGRGHMSVMSQSSRLAFMFLGLLLLIFGVGILQRISRSLRQRA